VRRRVAGILRACESILRDHRLQVTELSANPWTKKWLAGVAALGDIPPRQADAGVIQTGNPQLRSVLVEAVHRIMRCDARWMKLANQLRGRGQHACVVVAAIASRCVRWLHYQMQPETVAQDSNQPENLAV
jgi:hypothetical protein